MKKRFLALALALGVCLGLAAPASAYDMGHVGQLRIVACGDDHTAFLKGDGTLWVTGDNSRGQLGNGTREQSLAPIRVLDQVASVTCGKYQTAAIRKDGTLWTWGLTQNRQLGLDGGDLFDEITGAMNQTIPVKVMDNVSAVSCGEFHTAVIKADGSLWTWGNNTEGQLGNGIIGDQPSSSNWWDSVFGDPQAGPAPEPETVFHVLDDVVAVACGDSHTAALKRDGTLWTWGNNFWGQLGSPNISTKESCPTPTQVLDKVTAVSCGDYFTAAIRTDGSLWMWGSGGFDVMAGKGPVNWGDQTTPIKVMDNVSAVSCGQNHVAAIKTDGSLWMWGKNWYGEIGNDISEFMEETCPTPVQVLDDVIAVSCGNDHTVAITSDGTLWGWGNPDYGQLGNGGAGNVTIERWVEEIPLYPEPIPAHMAYLTYQTVPAKVLSVTSASGALPPTAPPAPVGGFTDVLETDFFAAPVEWAVENGVTSGTSATTFSPGNTCTTAEILTFLWRASGSPAPEGANPFSDVAESDFSYQAALWAYENGLVSGTALQGSAPCTRADTVTYLWKLAGSPAAPAASFTDVPAGADYAPAVAWAVDQGVTSGTGEGSFSPDNTCTRGEIVTFLYRGLGQ